MREIPTFLVSMRALRTVRKASCLAFVFRNSEIGLLEELWRKIGFVDELGDLHRVFGGNAQVGKLVGFERDVLALGVFVTFDNLRSLYDL